MGTVGFDAHHDGGNALIAEDQALLEWMELAWSWGYRDFHCEMYSRELEQLLEDEESLRFLPTLMAIKTLISRRWTIKVIAIRHQFVGGPTCQEEGLCDLIRHLHYGFPSP